MPSNSLSASFPHARLRTCIAIEVVPCTDRQSLAQTLAAVQQASHEFVAVLVCAEAERAGWQRWVTKRWPDLVVLGYTTSTTLTLLQRIVDAGRADCLAWQPAGMPISSVTGLAALRQGATAAMWLAPSRVPESTAQAQVIGRSGWVARFSTLDLDCDWGEPATWVLPRFAAVDSVSATAGRLTGGGHCWGAVAVCDGVRAPDRDLAQAPAISARSRVLVVIPHYRGEAWLAECLSSVLAQTRPPEAIVVLHDGPEAPPEHIVAQFPGVSLYRSAEQVGPYALVQSMIDQTDFDAVMFQDADDWSARERLALLLAEAERAGAELVGCQEIRVDEINGKCNAVCYPLDVTGAATKGIGHALLHPTSLLSTRLLKRLGGFATGLRFGADSEFFLRAAFVATIANVPEAAYFRRIRPASLTTAADTGDDSPARKSLIKAIWEKAVINSELRVQGQTPDLKPMNRRKQVALSHISGPALLGEAVKAGASLLFAAPRAEAIKFVSYLEPSGYGLAGIAYVRGLVNAGVPVHWQPLRRAGAEMVPWQRQQEDAPAWLQTVASDASLVDLPALLAATAAPVRHDTVVIQTVPEFMGKFLEAGRRNVGYTTWETDRLPSHWSPLLNQLQRIVVPCRFNAEVFAAGGVTVPIRVVPHIRRHQWNPFTPLELQKLRQQLQVPAGNFVFYSIADWWGGRKNIEGLLRAYAAAFSGSDAVSLVLKTSEFASAGGPHFPRLPTQQLVQLLLEQLAKNLRRPLPHIALVANNRLSGRDIDGLHELGDAYVSLTRGEGWGLGAFDAATRGTPVLMTAWGGQTEFLGEQWAGAIPYRLGPADVWPPEKPSFYSSQRWANADETAAATLMRQMVSNPACFRAETVAQAEWIANRYDEGKVSRELLAALSD